MRLQLLTFVALGCLFAALALPLIHRLVPPNPFYGFRVRSTMRNADLWYPANRRAGWLLLVAGLVDVVLALALYIPLRHQPSVYVLANVGVLLVTTLAAAVLSFIYLHRIDR